jgi:phosphohistidine phosphatase
MKTLYLTRHAKSSWKQPELSDFERPLNKRGKRDAPFMGEILEKKGINPDLIISSPAKRAKKTAIAIAEKLGYKTKKILYDENIYEASNRELVSIVKQFDDNCNSVIMFGHNPGLTMLHNFLCGYYIDNIPTCGVVALEFNSSWKDLREKTGKLLFFEHPKLHPK